MFTRIRQIISQQKRKGEENNKRLDKKWQVKLKLSLEETGGSSGAFGLWAYL